MWSIEPQQALRIKTWDDDDASIVYNTLSGETHLIEPPGADVLGLLARAPRTSEALATELADLFADTGHARIVEFMEATLVQLQAIGLVRATVL